MAKVKAVDHTTTIQDQELAELVPPRLVEDVYDLLDDILTDFEEAIKIRLQDEGWTPPA